MTQKYPIGITIAAVALALSLIASPRQAASDEGHDPSHICNHWGELMHWTRASYASRDVIHCLRMHQMDPDVRGPGGANPLHWLLFREAVRGNGKPRAFMAILAAGADPDAATSAGVTPLRIAEACDLEWYENVLRHAGAKTSGAPNWRCPEPASE